MKATVRLKSPVVMPVIAGAAGVVRGVTVTAADSALSPIALTARILIEWVVPFVRPVTVIGVTESAGLSAVYVPPSTETL